MSSGWCYLKKKCLASWVVLSQHEVMDLGEWGAEAFHQINVCVCVCAHTRTHAKHWVQLKVLCSLGLRGKLRINHLKNTSGVRIQKYIFT